MRLVNSKFLTKSRLCFGAGPDFNDLFRGKFAIPMIKPVMVASFGSGICVVLSFGAYSKVSRIDARRVIANVHDNFAFRNRGDKVFVRIPMSANRLFAGKQKDSITNLVFGSFPFPAAITFIKALFKNIFIGKDCVICNSFASVKSGVTSATKFASDSFCMSTNSARKRNFGLVCHTASFAGKADVMPFSWEMLL